MPPGSTGLFHVAWLHPSRAALAMLELELFIEAVVTHRELAPAGPPAHAVRRGPTLAPSNGGRVRVG